MKNIRSLVKECVVNVLRENLTTTVQSQYKKEIYRRLAQAGFQQKGNQPREYMEYYVWNFATIQVAIMPDTDYIYLERYYDNERFDSKNFVKKVPLPPQYDPKFADRVVNTCLQMKTNIKGDDSIFGGMDDLAEVNHTKNDMGKWVTSVGADNSLARAKVEHPNAIQQIVSVITKRFGTPDSHDVSTHEKLKSTIHTATELLASRAFPTDKWLVPLIIQAVEEVYWGTDISEVTVASQPEAPDEAYMVEYHSQIKNETPFVLGGSKYEYVNAKYPDGKIDIAVYAFAGDVVYGYKAFRNMQRLDPITPKPSGITEGFDPQSQGPNPAATEGETVYDPYTSMNAKMRQMEEGNAKWEAEGRCGECGTTGAKCNCKILKRVQAYIALGKKIKELEATPDAPELKDLMAQKSAEEPWVKNILQQAGYGYQSRPYLREGNAPSSTDIYNKFQADIDALKQQHPNLSFGYIGNLTGDSRIGDNGDDRAWYVWNVKNGERQKWGGFRTRELPEMWQQWQTAKAKFFGEPQHDPKDTWQAAKRQPDPNIDHYMGDGDRT